MWIYQYKVEAIDEDAITNKNIINTYLGLVFAEEFADAANELDNYYDLESILMLKPVGEGAVFDFQDAMSNMSDFDYVISSKLEK